VDSLVKVFKKTPNSFFLNLNHCNIAMKYKTMGVTKTDLFTLEQNELAQVAKVFAHPARIAIIQYLLKSNTCINGDLVQELGLAQATISQHLRELKQVGIIQGTIEGVSVSYCINPVRWVQIQQLFNEVFDQFQAPDSSCC
jgi:DNA-binding HxlR family transcriptional regulator